MLGSIVPESEANNPKIISQSHALSPLIALTVSRPTDKSIRQCDAFDASNSVPRSEEKNASNESDITAKNVLPNNGGETITPPCTIPQKPTMLQQPSRSHIDKLEARRVRPFDSISAQEELLVSLFSKISSVFLRALADLSFEEYKQFIKLQVSNIQERSGLSLRSSDTNSPVCVSPNQSLT